MAFPRLSASMLLASLILLLCWTSADLSTTSREMTPIAFETRDRVSKTFQVAEDLLSTLKDTSEMKKFAESAKKSLQILSKFASMAPGIAGALFSVVNMALAFIPQDDPVMTEVKKGFAEVNRKLDSLSIQISDLKTDVEWYNYVSIYSQDEVHILIAWKKFNEFIENSKSATNPEEKLQLAERFTDYYKETRIEASVAKFYHYLMIGGTSLSQNLNKLLVKKFKCDIREMAKYNSYFNTLLLKGMVLNVAYLKLIGFRRTSTKEAEHVRMFKKVYKAQRSAVDRCLNKAEHYMKKDVLEISKALSPYNKTAVAIEVKKKLDEKYDWYNWVVLVYDTYYDSYYMLYDLIKIPVGTITIAVGFTTKGIETEKMNEKTEQKQFIKELANSKKCYQQEGLLCKNVIVVRDKCIYETWTETSVRGELNYHKTELRDHVRVEHVIYKDNFAEVPTPFYQVGCSWGWSTSQMFLHYSRMLPVCRYDTCKNGGTCKRLLDSNEGLCECQDGYYGDSCEEQIDTTLAKKIDTEYPVTITVEARRAD